jgi:beta-glucanase (GH16 family)
MATTTSTTTSTTTLSTQPATALAPVGQSQGAWTLSFADEFSGPSLDTSKWSDQIWYGDRNADGTVNYDLSDGVLRMWPALNRSGQFFNRTFHSDGKFQQKYGYFEARMNLPRGRGAWPAFWLLGRYDGQAPYRPEIDIMEAYPGGGDSSGWGTSDLRPTTYGVSFHTDNGSEATRSSAGPFKVTQPDLSADFNVYGFKWESGGRMAWYLNGVQQGTTVFPGLDSQAMSLYLDLWFGSASGTPNIAETPRGPSNSFEVDYVRVWR